MRKNSKKKKNTQNQSQSVTKMEIIRPSGHIPMHPWLGPTRLLFSSTGAPEAVWGGTKLNLNSPEH